MRLLISGSWVRAPRWAPLFSLLIRHFISIDWILLSTKRDLDQVHTTSEEFENEAFTLKTHQMFSVHTTREQFNNATITGYFGFMFEENSVRKFHYFRYAIVFERLCFQVSTYKRKACFFKFLRFEERFRKVPSFRDRLVWMMGSASSKYQTVVLKNISDLVCMLR